LWKKGVTPKSISYIIMPRDQQSTVCEWPTLAIISGDRYSVVPQKDRVKLPSLTALALLKSLILMNPSLPQMIFYGVKSLWTTPFACK